jgi:hypothetical protein
MTVGKILSMGLEFVVSTRELRPDLVAHFSISQEALLIARDEVQSFLAVAQSLKEIRAMCRKGTLSPSSQHDEAKRILGEILTGKITLMLKSEENELERNETKEMGNALRVIELVND